MRKKKPTKVAIIIAVVFLLLLFGASAVSGILRNAHYFRIREVIAPRDTDVDLSYLKGENIFALDLRKESRYILEQNPLYRSVRLIRIPPNRLYVELTRRRPAALVKLYRIFSVDQEGVLFAAPGDLRDTDLPMITGLETKIFGPQVGRKYSNRELNAALNTIKAFRVNRVLRFYKIKRIDVAYPNNFSVFISLPQDTETPLWMEIKLGDEGLKGKMNILANVLMQSKNDLPNMRYIDLRFKDPVIKLKESRAH